MLSNVEDEEAREKRLRRRRECDSLRGEREEEMQGFYTQADQLDAESLLEIHRLVAMPT